MARFDAVAVLPIAARSIVGGVNTRVVGFVATIGCARESVATINRRSGLTSQRQMAHFRAVAVQIVATGTVVRSVGTSIVGFVARIRGAAHIVVAIRRGARSATFRDVTRLRTIAELPIAANAVDRSVYARIVGLVAGIRGACDAVVAIGRSAGLASQRRMTGLNAVAP